MIDKYKYFILSEKYKKDSSYKYHILIHLVKAFTTHSPCMGPGC